MRHNGLQELQMSSVQEPKNTVYDQDFYEWSLSMAQLLRQHRWDELDIENIAEEIESLGRSDKHAVENRLRVLLRHLLKWQIQPGRRSGSWQSTIVEQRARLEQRLNESTSLKTRIDEFITAVYPDARRRAMAETGLRDSLFPHNCPYTADQILSQDWLPE
jgi:hypothetical protein